MYIQISYYIFKFHGQSKDHIGSLVKAFWSYYVDRCTNSCIHKEVPAETMNFKLYGKDK